MKQKHDERDTSKYAQMGMAALQPGMVFLLEQIQELVDNFRTELAALQGRGMIEPTKRGRPRKVATGRSGWPDDPEERRQEMLRRMQVARQRRKGLSLSEERKKQWAALSPAKRKARLAAMAAGKTRRESKKRITKVLSKPTVKMEHEAVA